MTIFATMTINESHLESANREVLPVADADRAIVSIRSHRRISPEKTESKDRQ